MSARIVCTVLTLLLVADLCVGYDDEKLKYCKTTLKGPEYIGDMDVTVSGRKCQAWSSQTPHTHSRNSEHGYKFPDGNDKAARNYCRNPDLEADGPWCYTTDPKVRWEMCKIHTCAVNPCDKSPCKNGGDCTPAGTKFSCKCKAGFEGNDCSTIKATTLKPTQKPTTGAPTKPSRQGPFYDCQTNNPCTKVKYDRNDPSTYYFKHIDITKFIQCGENKLCTTQQIPGPDANADETIFDQM